jgi:hypothetical protein
LLEKDTITKNTITKKIEGDTMPTYRNDTESSFKVLDINDEEQIVQPGDSIQTYQILTLFGMTLTAAAPYFNPSEGIHDVTSTGPGDDKTITFDPTTDEIEIWNESSADITCFLQATANTPGLMILANSIRNISGLKDLTSKVVLQFSVAVTTGQCYLTELRG